MRSIKNYREGIRIRYQKEADKQNFGLSTKPVPTDFRRKGLHLWEEDLNAADRQIVQRFFGIREGDNARRTIEQFDKSLLRPIHHLFTKPEVLSEDELMLNFAALIVGFEPRPFSKFIATAQTAGWTDLKKPPLPDALGDVAAGMGGKSTTENPPKAPVIRTSGSKFLIWFAAVAAAVILLALGYQRWQQPHQCMQWQKNHYTTTSCMQHTASRNITPLDTAQFKVRKFKAHAQTVFFEDGDAVVWYLKHDGLYDFFTAPGYHPVLTEKVLLPVSRHIAMEVVAGHIEATE